MQTDKATAETLFNTHRNKMYVLVLIMLHDAAEAQDAVSEVFMHIVGNGTEIQPEWAESYLLTCVRNQCLKAIRSMQLKERVRKLLPIGDSVEMIPFEEQTDRLQMVLEYSSNEFTKQTYRIFRMRYEQHLSYKKIAEQLRISEAAVYKHLAQALLKLKKHFNP